MARPPRPRRARALGRRPGRGSGHASWLATQRSQRTRPPAVYASLTCLNASPVTKITRLYVTHCEDYRDPANGRTIGIYSFRDLNATGYGECQRSYLSTPSVFALNDLPRRPGVLRAPLRYDVSVLFQSDKEYCPHYAQAVRAGRIVSAARVRCRGIARCMCIRKCRCRDTALSSDGTDQRPTGKGFANSPGTVAEGAGLPVGSGMPGVPGSSVMNRTTRADEKGPCFAKSLVRGP